MTSKHIFTKYPELEFFPSIPQQNSFLWRLLTKFRTGFRQELMEQLNLVSANDDLIYLSTRHLDHLAN